MCVCGFGKLFHRTNNNPTNRILFLSMCVSDVPTNAKHIFGTLICIIDEYFRPAKLLRFVFLLTWAVCLSPYSKPLFIWMAYIQHRNQCIQFWNIHEIWIKYPNKSRNETHLRNDPHSKKGFDFVPTFFLYVWVEQISLLIKSQHRKKSFSSLDINYSHKHTVAVYCNQWRDSMLHGYHFPIQLQSIFEENLYVFMLKSHEKTFHTHIIIHLTDR